MTLLLDGFGICMVSGIRAWPNLRGLYAVTGEVIFFKSNINFEKSPDHKIQRFFGKSMKECRYNDFYILVFQFI